MKPTKRPIWDDEQEDDDEIDYRKKEKELKLKKKGTKKLDYEDVYSEGE